MTRIQMNKLKRFGCRLDGRLIRESILLAFETSLADANVWLIAGESCFIRLRNFANPREVTERRSADVSDMRMPESNLILCDCCFRW